MSTVVVHPHILQAVGIMLHVNKYSKICTRLQNSSLNDFYSGNDHNVLHEYSWYYMVFYTSHGMYQPTHLVQGATNLGLVMVYISHNVLNSQLGCIRNLFVDYIGVNGQNS